ncbi:hypothetical protein K458DRAFT_397524 [Lentithecium fluviatile CBS 122367]|uniref:Uncharacterized protein n=1 Tax=Lentithecium fluviatile CBS 122367 TaxID=1168545 RepID=A0A6G1ICZ6_9PLEO|nr:hypothetical protein K458DRAFT_397524 [Lentithecium fluviatile CBS 122367]
MGTINDPNFWKRFSVAVHQSDAEKAELASRPDLKHSYVALEICETTNPFSPITTPTSQCPSTPSYHHTPLSPVAPRSASPSSAPAATQLGERHRGAEEPHAKGRTPTPPRTPTRLQKKPSNAHARPTPRPDKSPRRPSLAHIHAPFTRHTNTSHLTLGLSGRPPSRFKFWTSVTADPSNRDSWLEGQRRKRKQRTWICWAFWVGFVVLVGGVVAAILVLRARGVI